MAWVYGAVLCVLVVMSTGLAGARSSDPAIVCYYTTWASERSVPAARMFVEDIDPHLCTHLILAFARINTVTMTLEASSPMRDLNSNNRLGLYEKFTRLKIINRKLLTMISIGGANARSREFMAVSKSHSTRMAFAENVVKFLRRHNFDGLDVDWEFPSSKDDSKIKFTLLLQSLMAAFRRDIVISGSHRLRLSIAVAVGQRQIDDAYEVDKISKIVDFINLMAYDFAGEGNRVTSFNSPLYPRNNPRFDNRLCQEWAVDYWIKKGSPREKLVLGMATSGKSFTLSNRTETFVGAKVNKSGVSGRHLQIHGVLAYLELCQLVGVQAVEVWDDIQKVPYAHWGTQWVGYDNARSFTVKTEWLLNQTLGGAMVWTLGFDDFRGKFCKDGKFPLTRAIKQTIDKFMTSQKTTPRTSISQPTSQRNTADRTTHRIDSPNGTTNSSSSATDFNCRAVESVSMFLVLLTQLVY